MRVHLLGKQPGHGDDGCLSSNVDVKNERSCTSNAISVCMAWSLCSTAIVVVMVAAIILVEVVIVVVVVL